MNDKGKVVVLMVVVAAMPLRVSAPAEPSASEIATLVERLGSLNYTVREEAHGALSKLGQQAYAALAAATNSSDPEQAQRAALLVRALHEETMWQGSKVSFSIGDDLASHAFAEITLQTGIPILCGVDGCAFNNAATSVDFPPHTLAWKAIDRICQISSNHPMPGDWREDGLLIMAGESGLNPVAYTGPFKAALVGAKRVYTQDINYSTQQTQETHTFRLTCQIAWERTFRLVAYRKSLIVGEVRTDGEELLSPVHPVPYGWSQAPETARQVALDVLLTPPAFDSAELTNLDLVWEVIAVGDMKTVEVHPLTQATICTQDDVELSFENCRLRSMTDQKELYEVNLRWRRDRVLPKPQDIAYREIEMSLLDTAGRPLRCQSKTLRMVGGDVIACLIFKQLVHGTPPDRFIFRYPRIRSQRKVNFVWHNVSLPQVLLK